MKYMADWSSFVEENPVVEDWLNSVTEDTAKIYAPRFYKFYSWAAVHLHCLPLICKWKRQPI